MSQITIERLKEIAETDFDDVDVMANAVRDLAVGLAQVMTAPVQTASAPPAQQSTQPSRRKVGKPIPPECRQTTCRRCGDDVVVFKSKSSGNPYLCDMELGEYQNKRQFLTASNWLHKCGGNR